MPTHGRSRAALVLRYVCDIGSPLAIPSVNAIVSLVAPAEKRGAWMGMTMGVQSLAQAVAPAVLGVTFDANYRAPFLIIGGMMLVSFMISAALIPMVPPSAHLAEPPVAKLAGGLDSGPPAAEGSEVAVDLELAPDDNFNPVGPTI